MSFDFNREQPATWQKLNEHYAIDRKTLLGRGTYGQVYRGYSFQRDCLISIKSIKPNQKIVAKNQILTSLNHQYVMGYYECSSKDKQMLVFLQYCPNGTLKNFIQRGLTQLQVLRLFRQLVEGMCYLSAKKRMHRDLKPQNILIGPEQDIKIVDYVLAHQTNDVVRNGEITVPIYAAPQIYLNSSKAQACTESCNVWSVGLILYQMLTGQHFLKRAYQQNSSKLLKQAWIQFHKGFKVVSLNQKYHPLWNCFINWLLDFDSKRRPTFADVLHTLKKVYKQFSQELQNGILSLQVPLQTFENYVQFNVKKYQTLLNLCQMFTSKDISIRNEFKYLIMFCSLMKYISFSKLFTKNLLQKKLTFNNEQLIVQALSKHPYLDMLIKKHQILLEQRYDFYIQQIKVTIIPKILNTYSQRQQSQHILQALNHILKLVIAMSKGEPVYPEQLYQSALKSILPVIQKLHQDVTTYFKQDELKVYLEMLISMQISERYRIERFMEKELIQNEKNRFREMSLAETIKAINSLKEQIF